jgi:predicted acylesterase/phospholipase RssA
MENILNKEKTVHDPEFQFENDSDSDSSIESFERQSLLSETEEEHEYYPEELAFSGGGVKGISFFGVLWEMESRGKYLTNLKRVSGTSIGAFVASIVALKIPISEVIDHMFSFDLNKIKEEYSVLNIGKNMSALNGETLYNLVTTLLKIVNAEHITLKEAYRRTRIELFITVTNLNQETVEYINYKQFPNLKLRKALMMAMALPGIFPRILHNNQEYCDGALIDNFPTSILSRNAWGIKMTKSGIPLPKGPLTNFQYISKLFTIRYENSKHNTVHINNILNIVIDDVSLTEFELNDDDKLKLIQRGRQSFIDFINNTT